MSERTFRQTVKGLGYRLRKHGDKYDLIETNTGEVKVKDSTLEDMAEWVAYTHFTPPGHKS